MEQRRRSRTQPLFVPAKEDSHTGASELPLFVLRSLCYQRGMLTALGGSKGPAPADTSQKWGRTTVEAAVSPRVQGSLR